MYRKSYERQFISWFMGTSDVLKVLKIALAYGSCNLRTFKTSRVTINHEMHEQVYTIFYLLYSQQTYSNALLCTRYALQKRFNSFQYAHMFCLNQSEIKCCDSVIKREVFEGFWKNSENISKATGR